VDRDELLGLLRAFEEKGLEYVLIGATAMGFHGVIRATEDVDRFVRATPENLGRLRCALRAVYADDPSVDEIRDVDLLGDYPAVRYYPPSGDLFLDVMTRLGTAESYETVEADVKEIEFIRVRVATPAALYRMQKNTVRPLDRRDAAALAERFDLEESNRMPVERFHSGEEMNAAPLRSGIGHPFDRFVRHCARFRRISPRRYPRGVFKFRSIEEAQVARDRAVCWGA
jgi:hypothetical protein